MVIIARISKGTVMDQVYIPKHRSAFPVGSYVMLQPVAPAVKSVKPLLVGINGIEPIKMGMVEEIFTLLSSNVVDCENIIITGSFVEPGFNFDDVDIIVITEETASEENLQAVLEKNLGIRAHIIVMGRKTLLKGMSTDPLYQSMMSACVAWKRFLYAQKTEVRYKLLDAHLLRSKLVFDAYDVIDGDEKYKLTRNMVAIALFLENERVTKREIDAEIKRQFGTVEEIKKNTIEKLRFLKKFRRMYTQTFKKIMEGIERESKQK